MFNSSNNVWCIIYILTGGLLFLNEQVQLDSFIYAATTCRGSFLTQQTANFAGGWINFWHDFLDKFHTSPEVITPIPFKMPYYNNLRAVGWKYDVFSGYPITKMKHYTATIDTNVYVSYLH